MIKKDIEFYQEQEKIIIQNLSDKVDEFVESQDGVVFDEVQTHFEEFYENIKHQYILSFNGDIDTVTSDAQKVLDRISKKDFQDYLKSVKRAIPDEDVLLQIFSKLPEPKRSEKISEIPLLIRQRNKQSAGNFQNCYRYLMDSLRLYTDTLKYYGLPISEIESLAEEKAAEWYKKPDNTGHVRTLHTDKAAEQAKRPFFDLPNSSASHLLFDILVAGENIANIPKRKKHVNHSTKYEVKASGNKRQVSMENYQGTAKVTVELADINILNKAGKKLLILSMIKANEQSLHNGELTRDYISFPLQELVDYGLYSRLSGARKGFAIGTDALTSIKIKGTIRKTKKSTATIQALEVPFTGAKIENNQCFIYLNNRIDWKFLAQYFTKIPKYYFKLSNRASDFLYYIFYLARQHTNEIAERGYFTVSFRAIHSLLQLPDPSTARNPQRDIKEVIENAITEIETEHNTTYGNKELSFALVYSEQAGISEYLDNGYLKVSLSGTFAEFFIEQSHTRESKIEREEKNRHESRKKLKPSISPSQWKTASRIIHKTGTTD